MKKALFIITLLIGININANGIKLILEHEDEGSDVIQVLISGNGGSCNAFMDSLGDVVETDCLHFKNSKNIKILCSKKKEICKTDKEVYNYIAKELSSPQKNQDKIDYYDERIKKNIAEKNYGNNLVESCNNGNAKACFDVGYKNYTTRNSDPSKYFRKACDGGNADGCYYLGRMYMKGEGRFINYSSAGYLFKKACDGDNANACNDLGYLYSKGMGGRQDIFKAIQYFKKACDCGNADGCKNLNITEEEQESTNKNSNETNYQIKINQINQHYTKCISTSGWVSPGKNRDALIEACVNEYNRNLLKAEEKYLRSN